jgi:uncharacterized protein (TIGR02246 family)
MRSSAQRNTLDGMLRSATLLSVCWCFLAAGQESPPSEFQPLVTTFLSSWNKHDAHAFTQLFDTDAVIITVGGTRVQGPSAIENYMQGLFTGASFQKSVYAATIILGRRISPDVAIIDLSWEMTGALFRDGTPRGLRKGTLNWVVRQKDGQWRIVSYHNAEFAQNTNTTAK